jgi:hypothetical protein
MTDEKQAVDEYPMSQADWERLLSRLRGLPIKDKGTPTLVLKCQKCGQAYSDCRCWPAPKAVTE